MDKIRKISALVILGMLLGMNFTGLLPDVFSQKTDEGSENEVELLEGELPESQISNNFLVTTTADSGKGSLRQVILNANANTGTDMIGFNISSKDIRHFYYKDDAVKGQITPGNRKTTIISNDAMIADIDPDYPHSWYSIQLKSALPTITDPVIITGYTQQGAQKNSLTYGNNAMLMIELDGTLAGKFSSGLHIAAGNSLVRGLVIQGFSLYGIQIDTKGGNVIEGNYIGSDVSGVGDAGNFIGVCINNTSGNRIGGIVPAAANLISGNDLLGVFISGSTATKNLVQGNYIGTDGSGMIDLGNGAGVLIYNAPRNIIGGDLTEMRNIILDNGISSVWILGPSAKDNIIKGNYMDTKVISTSGAKDNSIQDNIITNDLTTEIIFVDSKVQEYEILLEGLSFGEVSTVTSYRSGIKVEILETNRDGIEQITEVLADYNNVIGIHILSHGSKGSLRLGSTTLSASNLEIYADQIRSWRFAFTDEADVLIYGCNVAEGDQGLNFVEQLSELTWADIAASNDPTGSIELGGDWDLEVNIGEIESAVPFSISALANYNNLLTDIDTTAGQGILDGLEGLADWGEELEDFEELARSLPIVDESIGEVLQLAQTIREHFVDTLEGEGLGTITVSSATIASALETALQALDSGAVVTDLSDSNAIKFNVQFRGDITASVPFGLGEAGENMRLSFDTIIDFTAFFDIDLSFGFDLDPTLSPSEAFFIDTTGGSYKFLAGGEVSATLNFDFDLGFLRASIVDGTLNLTANLEVTLPDPNANGLVTLNELAASILSDDSLDVAVGNEFSISLPVEASLGGSAIGTSGTIVISNVTGGNLFDTPDFTVEITDADQLNFTRITPGDVFGMLITLGSQLEAISSALDVLGGIPLVEDVISSVTDFISMLKDMTDGLFDPGLMAISPALTDLSGAADFSISVNGLAEVPVTVAAGSYADLAALITAINSALGIPDTTSAFSGTDLAGMGLDELLTVSEEDEQLVITAINESVEDFRLLSVNNVAQTELGFMNDHVSRPLFKFNTAQAFEQLLDSLGLLDGPLSITYDEATSSILFNLGMGAEFSAIGQLGFRETLDLGGIAELELVGSAQGSFDAEASFELGAGIDLTPLTAATLLSKLNGGLGVRITGTGEPDLNITLSNGYFFSVDLFGATTLQDVIDKIEDGRTDKVEVIVDALLSALVIEDLTSGSGDFYLSAAGGSTAALDLGFGLNNTPPEEGEPLVSASLIERFFINTSSKLHAAASISASGINLFAALGFLEIGIEDGSLTEPLGIIANLSLKDPDSSGRIFLSELTQREIDSGGNFSFSVADLLSIDVVGGELVLPLSFFDADSFGIDDPAPTIIIGFIDDGDGSISLDVHIDTTALENLLESFQNLSLGDILGLVAQIALSLAEDFDLFNTKLPLLDASINDIIGFVNETINLIVGPLSNLREQLLNILGNSTASGTIIHALNNSEALEAFDKAAELNGLDGLRRRMAQAIRSLEIAIRGLPTNFNLLTDANPTRLIAGGKAFAEIVDIINDLDLSGLSSSEKTAFETLNNTLNNCKGQIRDLIPSSDTLLKLVLDAIGFELPEISDSSFIGPIQTALQTAETSLEYVKGRLEYWLGNLPGATPASVEDYLEEAIDIVDEALDLVERAEDWLDEATSSSVDVFDLLRAYRLGKDIVEFVTEGIENLSKAIDDVIGAGDPSLDDLQDDLENQNKSLIENVTDKIIDLVVSKLLSNLGGSLLTFDYDDGTLLVNLHYDLDVLTAAGIDDKFDFDFSIENPLGDLLPLTFETDITGTLNLSGSFDLGFGIDLADLTSPVFFLQSSSKIEFRAGLKLDAVIEASFGAISISLGDDVGANATLYLTNVAENGPASISLGLIDTGATDGRVLFSELGSAFDLNLDAYLNITLPVYVNNNPVQYDPGTGMEDVVISLQASLTDLTDFDIQIKGIDSDALNAILESLTEINLANILAGIETFLILLENALGSDFLTSLPIIGEPAAGLSTKIERFRTEVFEPLRTTLEALDNASAIENAIDENLTDLLETLLGPENGKDYVLVTFLEPNGNGMLDKDASLEIFLNLSIDEEFNLPFDLGLDAFVFEFETTGDVKLTFNITLKIGLGLSRQDGFYLNLSSDPEIGAMLSVGVSDDTYVKASLFFLTVNATPSREGDLDGASFDAGFVWDLGSGKVLFSDLDTLSPSPGFIADVDIDLFIRASIEEDETLPSLSVELDVDWSFNSADPDATLDAPSADFRNLTLDLGEYLTKTIKPLLDELKPFISPLKPILELLDTEIPVISQLAQLLGQDPITFGDALQFLGKGFDSVRKFLNVLETVLVIIDLLDSLVSSLGTGETIQINFSNLDFDTLGLDLRDSSTRDTLQTGDLSAGFSIGDILDEGLAAVDELGNPTGSGNDDEAENLISRMESDVGFDTSGGLGITFPIFQDPGNIFGLLLGKRATLVEWDIPRLAAEFSFFMKFGPIIPPIPLYVTISGGLELFVDLQVGFDTRGLEDGNQFFDGFYFKDVRNGEDIPELGLIAHLGAAAELNIVIAAAGVEGGVRAGIYANWNDPDKDGKVYFDELVMNFNRGIECVFDLQGALTAYLEAYVKIGFDTWFGFITLFEKRFTLVSITLIDFSLSCPLLPDPIPATKIGDTVYLNIGPRAPERQPGAKDVEENIFIIGERDIRNDTGVLTKLVDINDNGAIEKAEILAAGDLNGNDVIEDDVIAVFGFNEVVVFSDVGSIQGDGGKEDDEIILDPSVKVDSILRGGSENDKIEAGTGAVEMHGDNGEDILIGGAGNDEIHGGNGNDQIWGMGGSDDIYGDSGDDMIAAGYGKNTPDEAYPDLGDYVSGGGGADDITGESGDDTLEGDGGPDQILGGGGNDTIRGGGDTDNIEGGAGSDLIYGGGGNDIIFAEGGDVLQGQGGDDVVFGGDGDDEIKDAFEDDMTGEIGIDEGSDIFFGGDGDDVIISGITNDRLFGGNGNDQLEAGPGNDYIEGGGDSDYILAGDGNDRIIGGSTPDNFLPGEPAGEGLLPSDFRDRFIYDDESAFPTDFADLANPVFDELDSSDFSSSSADSDDTIYAGDGDDFIIGDNGAFYRTIDANTTFAAGGSGADRIYGEGGDDTIFGGGRDDLLRGDRVGFDDLGDDIIVGDQGFKATTSPTIIVSGTSSVPNSGGDDRLHGVEGEDIIIGGDGDDRLFGDDGVDILVGDNVKITLTSDIITRIETIDTNSGGDDIITGDRSADIAFGGFGDDWIYGGGLTDLPGPSDTAGNILLGDNGFIDFVNGQPNDIESHAPDDSGTDTIRGSARDDIMIGGGEGDRLFGLSGEDIILGDHGSVERDDANLLERIASLFESNGGPDTIEGDSGDDIILGGAADDTLFGDIGADIILGDNGELEYMDDSVSGTLDLISSTSPTIGDVDSIEGNEGIDIILGGAAGDDIWGHDGDDVILGDNGQVVQPGGVIEKIETTDPAIGGSDMIEGNNGNDTILGGAYGDDIWGHEGHDVILGDNGKVFQSSGIIEHIFTTDPAIGGGDTIEGNNGNDTILGGAYGDDIWGHDGYDVILGDNGNITKPSGVVELIKTTDPAIGGSDTIEGNNHADIILGGADGDLLEGNAGKDIILGDNGMLDYVVATVDGGTPDPTTLDLIISTSPNDGGVDTISGGTENDIVFGGTAGDTISGNEDNDLLFGDHAKVERIAGLTLDLGTLPVPTFTFTAIFTAAGDGGDGDTIHGNTGEDILLGQQGDDYMFGDEDDDDLIGGHNVVGGIDELDTSPGLNDIMDGGSGDDTLAGDNAEILRRTDAVSPRIRALNGETLYDANGDADVDETHQANPSGARGRDITLLDHSDSPTPYTFGNDYMAGGPDEDVMFGQLGNDMIQGDASVGEVVSNTDPSVEGVDDGDDYIEGNGDDDLIFGNLGQDDIVGGSSDLFGLTTSSERPDDCDIIFGGAGTRIARNDPGDESDDGHANDADYILGDNGNIFRIVGTNGVDSGDFLSFTYDNYGNLTIIPRAIHFLDYTPGGSVSDKGNDDLIHGEAGDDLLHGMTGNDVIFGEGQDDDIFGGPGHDRLYGGLGKDGVLGDDGKILINRNGETETLYGITVANQQTAIKMPGPFIGAVVDITGRLKKVVDLAAFEFGGNDIIYGGLGDDWLHGGAGDDAISGAEALPDFYNSDPQTNTPPLPYDPSTRKFDAYDADNPFTKINDFLLNFEAVDGSGNKINDGKDRLFGDNGNDWLVGGTMNDRQFGGMGDDLMNCDDNHDTNGGLNNMPDPIEFADADFAYGGGGLDVLIANTGGDRMFDWTGEFNSYFVPFSPFGIPTVVREINPHCRKFLLDLSEACGADQTLTEPNAELGMVTQQDPEWGDQHGGPRDPQAGNLPGVKRDTQGEPEDDS